MLHSDYQYGPMWLPEIIRPIKEGHADDIVLGSRLLGANPMQQGMPWWKFISNRFLTAAESIVFGLDLSEYHTGYRAFRSEILESVNIAMNSDNFIFDREVHSPGRSFEMPDHRSARSGAIFCACLVSIISRKLPLWYFDSMAPPTLRLASLWYGSSPAVRQPTAPLPGSLAAGEGGRPKDLTTCRNGRLIAIGPPPAACPIRRS
jgi:hypothetical protein